MKSTMRLAVLGLILSLVLAACASQPGTPDTSVSSPDSPVATNTDAASGDSESTTSDQPEPEEAPREERDYQIITLLPPDAIPSIDDPVFLTVDEADNEYAPDEEVLGVVFDGEARAYSVPLLSSHEIVNDTVAGHKIAVTW